jgi:hypothetical protein
MQHLVLLSDLAFKQTGNNGAGEAETSALRTIRPEPVNERIGLLATVKDRRPSHS